MKLIIFSDIHANLTSFKSLLQDAEAKYGDKITYTHLGDAINYGMRSNEVIKTLMQLVQAKKLIVNIAGNHEAALLGKEYHRFSSDRGKQALDYTKRMLTEDSNVFIASAMHQGPFEIIIDKKMFLFVHGTLYDQFWGFMNHEEWQKEIYKKYDYVISSHSHKPFFYESFFDDVSPQAKRGKKKVIFLNPGSVGQPRNHNPYAQYIMLDTKSETIHFNKVRYNVDKEIKLFDGSVHPFYKKRLREGV